MSVTPAFCPLSLQALLNSNGQPIVGGSINVFQAGTTTPITTYADGGMATANPNPLTSDGFGRIPPIYVGAGNYKVEALDQNGALLFVVDNLPGGVDYVAQAAAAAAAAGANIAGATTGDVKAKHGFSSDAGWLWLNGQTIGNPSSGATARADADAQNLFGYLWNCDPSLAVSGGRGASANQDFQNSKTIALPDYRGRSPRGIDQMGAPSTAGVITGATTNTPNQVGAQVGSETVTLTQGQLPAVAPTITVSGSGTHTHSAATSGSDGGHQHQLGDPGHSHVTNVFASDNGGIGPQQGGATAVPIYTKTGYQTNTVSTGIVLDNGGLGGTHGHAVTIDGGNPGGSHSHTASSSNLGSGQAHSNIPPDILVWWHIKL